MANIPDLKIKQPFSGLSPAECERLDLLIEECAEVIQIACKVLRHGYTSHHPEQMNGPDNRAELEREMGDVRYAMILLSSAGDVDKERIHEWAYEKSSDVRQYLHHQSKDLLHRAEKNSA